MRTLIKNQYFILLLIVLTGFFFRFYKLDQYPIQLNHDEVSQIYDLKSIMETGKDIYGNFMPLAFPSTGEYKVGHYIYISTIPYLLLGDREITIRVPAAFFGSLTVLGVFLLIRVLTKNTLLALLSAAVISITPSEIFYSRKSFENVIGSSLDIFGLYFLLTYLKEGAAKKWAYLGIFLLGLAMYIYTSHTMIVPPLLLFLTLIFKEKIIGQKRELLKPALFWLILITPLIILTSLNSDLRFRAQSVFITQDRALGKTIDLVGNKYKAYLDFIPTKLLNQFDPAYLFLNGLDFTSKSSFGMGPLLLWQFPFLIAGFIFLIRKKGLKKAGYLLPGLAFLAMIPSALTFEDFSPHRSVLSFTMLGIISAFGLYWVLQNIFKLKNKLFKNVILGGVFLSLVLNLVYFLRMYTINYPYERSEKMHYPFKEISLYAWSESQNFDAIVFDPQFGDIEPQIGVGTPYYLVHYGQVPPVLFQKQYHKGSKPREMLFDKFSIRQIYWPEDQKLKNTLIIASPWSVPEKDIEDKSKIIKKFFFYNGKLAFYAIKL